MKNLICLLVLTLFPALVFGLPITNLGIAPACSTHTLSYYEAHLGDASCSVAGVNYREFEYVPITPAHPGALDNLANLIIVTPSLSGPGFSFSSPFTSSSDLGSLTFPLVWVIRFIPDPAPILGGEDLSLDPPTGGVKITESLCVGTYFLNPAADSTCRGIGIIPGAESHQLVVTPSSPFAAVTFSQPASFMDVQLEFELTGPFQDFGGGGTLDVLVPEPGAVSLAAGGLLLLAGLYRRNRLMANSRR